MRGEFKSLLELKILRGGLEIVTQDLLKLKILKGGML